MNYVLGILLTCVYVVDVIASIIIIKADYQQKKLVKQMKEKQENESL
jgi:hypothetical protein